MVNLKKDLSSVRHSNVDKGLRKKLTTIPYIVIHKGCALNKQPPENPSEKPLNLSCFHFVRRCKFSGMLDKRRIILYFMYIVVY
jgi:hypothetical protein